MVKILHLLLLSFLLTFRILAQDVKVSTSMSEYNLVEGEPLQGTISITHDEGQKVRPDTFILKGKPLTVEFVREVKISQGNPLVISIYSFKLPASKSGLHILDAVSVNVGNKQYQSPISTYQVNGSKSTPTVKPTPPAQPTPTTSVNQSPSTTKPSIPSPKDNVDSLLRIEAKVAGSTKLYPKQRTKFIYRFLYSGYIELVKETLPLLEAIGLKKIGTTQHRDYLEGNLSVSEFSQEVEADLPGQFTFGPSIIEGTSYTMDSAGNKTYSKKILHTEAPPIMITVESFPEKNKPTSFNGSIGQYLLNASLISEPKTIVGENVVLSLELIGDPTNFSTLSAPDLCCQPGFSGMFKSSDLPPISSIQENSKSFTVTLKPLTSAIREVPPIEFSSWDPTKNNYVVLRSNPIPLTVTDMNGTQAPIPLPSIGADNNQAAPPLGAQPQPINIHRNEPVAPTDLSNKWGGTWWILLTIPVALGLIFLQKKLQLETQQQKTVTKKAEEILQEALLINPDSPQFYQGIQQAFMLLLVEKEMIPNASIEPERLPQTGPTGEVRNFLMKLNAARFAKNQGNDPLTAAEADALFKKIQD